MYIRRFAVEGFAGLADQRLDDPSTPGLGRSVTFSGSPRARAALADALTLGLAAFGGDDLRAAASALGWGEIEVTGAPLPEQVTIARPEMARHLTTGGDDARALRIEMSLALDPPQFDALRAAARREPALGPALLGLQDLTLAVGWLFTRDFQVASPSLLSAKLGEIALDPTDQPRWWLDLLRGLQGRLRRRRPGSLDLDAYARADRSGRPADRARLDRLQRDLLRAPFQMERLYLVDGPAGLYPALGDALVPAAAMGPEATDALGLLADVHLQPSEILLTERPDALGPRRLLPWLRRQAEADGSPLEQIWMAVDGRADVALKARSGRPAPPRTELTFRRGR